jgi:hypothetical protein
VYPTTTKSHQVFVRILLGEHKGLYGRVTAVDEVDPVMGAHMTELVVLLNSGKEVFMPAFNCAIVDEVPVTI